VTLAETIMFLARRARARLALPTMLSLSPAPLPHPEPPRFALHPHKPTHHSFALPTDGVISSRFGDRLHPILHRWRMHKGVDIAARRGSPVWATAAGTVLVAEMRGSAGREVILDHGHGRQTRYGHLDAITVHVGQKVEAGDQVGSVGQTGLATGPHVHYEIRQNGVAVDPVG